MTVFYPVAGLMLALIVLCWTLFGLPGVVVVTGLFVLILS